MTANPATCSRLRAGCPGASTEREWARLDKALDRAYGRRRTVVDMMRDRRVIYPFDRI